MKYRRPSRLRRVAKWVGVCSTAALAVALLVSLCRIESYKTTIGADAWQSQLGNGAFVIAQVRPPPGFPSSEVAIGRSLRLEPSFVTNLRGPFISYIVIPMWMLVLPAFVVTAVLWYRDRRPPKGPCLHCGYNLTGNESGVCPECATPVPKGEATA